jgi:hypothetical protein
MKNRNLSLSHFLILVLLTFACTGKNQVPTDFQLSESGEILRLPLDTATSNISDGLQFFQGENPLLFSLNWMENSIQIYDLTQQRKIKDLKFDYEGPNGVLDIMGIYVHSLDSIFLFNQLVSQITLIDSSGTIKSKITYEVPDQYSPAFIHNAYFQSKPILNGKKLLVKTHIYGQITSMTNDQLNEKELIYQIDLETGKSGILGLDSGKTEFPGMKYPKDYLLGGFKIFEPSIAYGAGKYVVSMFGDHRLFYTDTLGTSLKEVVAKSNYLNESIPLFPKDADGLAYRKYSFYSPHYETIDFDPYRQVFIRFAFHGFEQDPAVPVQEMRNHSGPFSIQVFDTNLNLVSEKFFDKNRYHPFDYFITKEGLYLSTNHPLNPQTKEDEFAFELIEFKPIENQ